MGLHGRRPVDETLRPIPRPCRSRSWGPLRCSGFDMARALLLLSSVWLSSGSASLGAGARVLQGHSDHSYKPNELVALYANKAGPFHNPRCVWLRASDAPRWAFRHRCRSAFAFEDVTPNTHTHTPPTTCPPLLATCAWCASTRPEPDLTPPRCFADAQRNIPVL
jgi:hypothetical protein